MLAALLVAGTITVNVPGSSAAPASRLILATTTSVKDSGLLDVLLPPFSQSRGVRVDVIAVGTGQALATARRGDADVVIVHDPVQEAEFVSAGHGMMRSCIAYNTFVIVGPATDPAQVRGAQSATDAFVRIARRRAPFISRGDGSGTETKEQEIWKLTELSPRGQPWYISSGAGMGMTLNMAHEKQAYTLADIATYLSMQSRVQLALLHEGDLILRNQYAAIATNPARAPGVNIADASALIAYLVSEQGQRAIAAFGRDRFPRPLFIPLGGRCVQ